MRQQKSPLNLPIARVIAVNLIVRSGAIHQIIGQYPVMSSSRTIYLSLSLRTKAATESDDTRAVRGPSMTFCSRPSLIRRHTCRCEHRNSSATSPIRSSTPKSTLFSPRISSANFRKIPPQQPQHRGGGRPVSVLLNPISSRLREQNAFMSHRSYSISTSRGCVFSSYTVPQIAHWQDKYGGCVASSDRHPALLLLEIKVVILIYGVGFGSGSGWLFRRVLEHIDQP